MSTLKLFFALTIGLVCVLASEAVLPQNKNVSDWENKWRRIHQSRPHRLEGPLRYDNISDIEVREIEKEVREIMPGAIVNISGVTTGCPCEDGPKCTDQVWIVAYRPERSTGLMLSKIDGHWRVGPVQSWWLRYSELHEQLRATLRLRGPDLLAKYRRFGEEQQKLSDSFPPCVGQPMGEH